MASETQLIEDILNDTSLVQSALKNFVDSAKEMVQNAIVSNNYESWNFDAVLHAAEIAKNNWDKGSLMNVALWILFFAITGEYYPTEQFKYQNVQAFLKAYEGRFDGMEPEEQEMLKNEANWFNVVSTLLPPSKNKGLTMQVVPRLVEGWQAKYVTGSGQTEATNRRVYIFEKEGRVIPCGRGGCQKSTNPPQKKKTSKAAKKTKHASSKTPAVVTRDSTTNRVLPPQDPLFIPGETLDEEGNVMYWIKPQPPPLPPLPPSSMALAMLANISTSMVEASGAANEAVGNKHEVVEDGRQAQAEVAQDFSTVLSHVGQQVTRIDNISASAGTEIPSVKTLQRMATERLFQPVSHKNTPELTSLCDELGLDSSDIDSAEAMLKCIHSSYLQRLAACLKIGPQCLFEKAFLASTSVPYS